MAAKGRFRRLLTTLGVLVVCGIAMARRVAIWRGRHMSTFTRARELLLLLAEIGLLPATWASYSESHHM